MRGYAIVLSIATACSPPPAPSAGAPTATTASEARAVVLAQAPELRDLAPRLAELQDTAARRELWDAAVPKLRAVLPALTGLRSELVETPQRPELAEALRRARWALRASEALWIAAAQLSAAQLLGAGVESAWPDWPAILAQPSTPVVAAARELWPVRWAAALLLFQVNWAEHGFRDGPRLFAKHAGMALGAPIGDAEAALAYVLLAPEPWADPIAVLVAWKGPEGAAALLATATDAD